MKRLFLIAVCVAVASLVNAGPKYRAVVMDTVCNVPISAIQQTAERFCRQFQSCPDSLFEWAYLGLEEDKTEQKKTKESRDVIQLRYKDRTYDPIALVGDVAIDIYVLGVRWWKDTHLVTHCSHQWFDPDRTTTHMTATYTGALLDDANCIIRMEYITPTTTHIYYTFDFTFGTALALFISDKMWHNAIEWRFEVILRNLIEYAETGTVLPKEKKTE